MAAFAAARAGGAGHAVWRGHGFGGAAVAAGLADFGRCRGGCSLGVVAQCAVGPESGERGGGSMSLWHWIVLACGVAFATKWLGYAIPARFLQNPRMTHIAAC